MKKAIVILCCFLLLTACANDLTVDGVTYETYGLLNKEEVRNPNVEYRLVMGNVIWSVILIETVAFPIYFLGFSIYEPVQVKK